MRGMRVIAVGTVAMLALLSAAGLAAAKPASDSLEPVIYSFELAGSHGYAIAFSASSGGRGERGAVSVFVTRPGARAVYTAHGTVTANSIRADFGALGRLDLAVRLSGTTREARVPCSKLRERFEPGEVEGAIAFRGERGYTSATASRVALIPRLIFPCPSGYGESSGPGIPGARLRGASYAGGRVLTFQVNKNRAKGPTIYKASLRERRDWITIEREVNGVSGPSGFSFGRSLRTATLSPPAPFAGTAVASRSANAVTPLWAGNLTLDFPGHRVTPWRAPLSTSAWSTAA